MQTTHDLAAYSATRTKNPACYNMLIQPSQFPE